VQSRVFLDLMIEAPSRDTLLVLDGSHRTEIRR
jgi:hypothetical protein